MIRKRLPTDTTCIPSYRRRILTARRLVSHPDTDLTTPTPYVMELFPMCAAFGDLREAPACVQQ